MLQLYYADTHQRVLREGYAALLHNGVVTDHVANHPEHCFDYLRQSVMCAADLTLEKARVDPDGHRRATDGWGTSHVCKDWGQVEDAMRDNRWKYAF